MAVQCYSFHIARKNAINFWFDILCDINGIMSLCKSILFACPVSFKRKSCITIDSGRPRHWFDRLSASVKLKKMIEEKQVGGNSIQLPFASH